MSYIARRAKLFTVNAIYLSSRATTPQAHSIVIKYYYKNLRSKQVSETNEYQPGSWVCVEHPTDQEVQFLVTRFKLDAGHLLDALDEDEMPRLEKKDDKTYIFVRYVYASDKRELTTAPLLLVVGPDVLITISLHDMPRLKELLGGKVEFSTTQRTKLVLHLLYEVIDGYGSFISDIRHQTKLLQARLKGREISNQDFIDFVLIEDELNEFVSALLPTTAVLRRLLLGKHIPLHDDDQDVIEDLLLDNEQSIEACNSSLKSIVSIRQVYAIINTNSLDRSMKVLTAFTVLITLPNVVYGLYGTNIPLPFQHEPWAFGFVFPLSLALSWLVFVIARNRRIF